MNRKIRSMLQRHLYHIPTHACEWFSVFVCFNTRDNVKTCTHENKRVGVVPTTHSYFRISLMCMCEGTFGHVLRCAMYSLASGFALCIDLSLHMKCHQGLYTAGARGKKNTRTISEKGTVASRSKWKPLIGKKNYFQKRMKIHHIVLKFKLHKWKLKNDCIRGIWLRFDL